MATIINKLSNANIYVDGVNLLGRFEEITLPDVQHIMTEHKPLGLLGSVKLFAGIEAMEVTIKWTSLYAETAKKYSDPRKRIKLMVRSNLESHDNSGLFSEEKVVTNLICSPLNIPLGMYKKSENVDFTSKLTVFYVKQEIGGDTILEVDVLAPIYNVNGVDMLKTYKANLGI